MDLFKCQGPNQGTRETLARAYMQEQTGRTQYYMDVFTLSNKLLGTFGTVSGVPEEPGKIQ